jgi:hypothetical protein
VWGVDGWNFCCLLVVLVVVSLGWRENRHQVQNRFQHYLDAHHPLFLSQNINFIPILPTIHLKKARGGRREGGLWGLTPRDCGGLVDLEDY